MSDELQLSHLSDRPSHEPHSELGFVEVWIIKAVANRKSGKWMAEHLSENTDENFSYKKITRYLAGLAKKNDKSSGKYAFDTRYLKPIPTHPDNSVNYRITDEGRKVVRDFDVPLELSHLAGNSGDGLSDLGFGPVSGSSVRPHKCWWREQVRRKPGEGDGSTYSWGDRRAYLVDKDVSWEVVEKELPHREQSARGLAFWKFGVRIVLFENTVLVKYDLPESDEGIFPVLDEWWSVRDAVVDWLESEFPVRVRSKPLDVSMPLSTQEWGDVRNSFAEWIESNPEFQDDTQNALFEVQNDRGERIFHVDTSPKDGLGNDVAEGEFPHSQFGAEHITNLKQAVKWMATLGVRPQDFRAAIWVRNNRDELKQLVELDGDQLRLDVEDLEKKVESVARDAAEKRDVIWSAVEDVDSRVDDVEALMCSEVSSLEQDVDDVEARIDSEVEDLEDGVEDVEARVDDAVDRVDSTWRELQEESERLDSKIEQGQEQLASAVESNQRTNRALAQTVSNVERTLQGQDRELLEEIKDLRQKRKLQEQDLRSGHREVVDELQELKQLQQRTFVEKAAAEVKALGGMAKSGVSSVKEKISGLF